MKDEIGRFFAIMLAIGLITAGCMAILLVLWFIFVRLIGVDPIFFVLGILMWIVISMLAWMGGWLE